MDHSSSSQQPTAPPPLVVDAKVERQLTEACSHGDVAACTAAIAQLYAQSRATRLLTTEATEDLIGFVFASAAAGNHLGVMEYLLTEAGLEITTMLLYGICRDEKRFPPRTAFHCCFAMRYMAYAAVVSIEQSAFAAFEFLVTRRVAAPTCREVELLMDVDVERSFRLAFSFANRFTSSTPYKYRPFLYLLLRRYPQLLLPLVQPDSANLLVLDNHELDNAKNAAALRSSLLYDYMLNCTLCSDTMEHSKKVASTDQRSRAE